MGYEKVKPERPLSCKFSSFSIYEISGINADFDSAIVCSSVIRGHSYSMAIGKSPNEISRAIVNDDFSPDEQAWREQNATSGLFFAISIGPTTIHTIVAGHVKQGPDEGLTTIDSFSDAKSELRGIEQLILPRALSAALTVYRKSFDTFNIREIFSTFFGETDSGQRLHDLRFSARGTLDVRRNATEQQIRDGLAEIVAMAPAIDARTSVFFSLGLKEGDETKRFLYFFLSLEININTAFRSYRATVTAPKSLDQIRHCTRLSRTASLHDPRKKVDWIDLTSRLTYLAIHKWKALGDDDIDEFKILKGWRNDIAHGDLTEAPVGAALRAELLAVKFIRLPQ